MYSALHQLHEADEWHAVQCTESVHDDARKAVMEAACLEDEKENTNSDCMISALYRALHHQMTDHIHFLHEADQRNAYLRLVSALYHLPPPLAQKALFSTCFLLARTNAWLEAEAWIFLFRAAWQVQVPACRCTVSCSTARLVGLLGMGKHEFQRCCEGRP